MFHTDAVQAVGKIPIDLKNTKIDMLSLSGHKLHAPKGIGVLYLRRAAASVRCCAAATRSAAVAPAPRTGVHRRPRHGLRFRRCPHGTENTTVRALRTSWKGILSQITHCFPTGDVVNRLPNTSNIAFEYIEGEAILLLLNKLGIAASRARPAPPGSLEPSHVMRAMGIPYTAAHGTIRFSLSVYNTEEEVDRVIAAVPPIIEQLRKLSPYWGDKAPPPTRKPASPPTYA